MSLLTAHRRCRPIIAYFANQKQTKNVTRVQWKPRPIEIIGHRGSPYTALENTARSFVHAALAGAHGVELDVFLLKCGTLVVFHGTGTDENPGLLKSYCGVPGSM